MQAIVLAIALLAPAVVPSSGDVVVPERLVGTWASSPVSCGSDADDLALRITSHHVFHWESDGPIRAVVVRGNEIALISELSGESEIWLSTAKFELSADGHILTDSTTIPGKEIVRYRCSESAGTRPNSSFKPTLLRKAA